MNKIDIKIVVDHDGCMPVYGSDEAAGFDFHANANVVIKPGDTQLIPTGVKVELPKGYEIQIRPRSGKSLRTKLRVANSPGTIDSDFRGEIMIICDNIGDEEIAVWKGERIAQGVLKEVPRANFINTGYIEETERNEKGFGSTGE